jgi:hypothetical protein
MVGGGHGRVNMPPGASRGAGDRGWWSGQGAIADCAHERLGRADAAIILLRKLYARDLKALAEGRPLKQWQRTERLTATGGV